MSIRNYVDNAAAKTVPAGCNSSTTSIIVNSTSSLPTVPFTATLDRGTASAEQVLVTAAVGTTLTVTRNHGGTGAFSHAAGCAFEHTVDAIDMREANTHVNATGAVHGLSGSIVGATDTQTLTNKTLTSPVLTGAVADATSTLGGVSGATLAAERAAWTAYTPTFTNCTSPSGEFKYLIVGKALFIRGNFSGGVASTFAVVKVSLPVGVALGGSTVQFVPGEGGSGNAFWTISPSGGSANLLVTPNSLAAGTALSSGVLFQGTLEIA